jgi:serine/threonine protein kinase
MLSEVTDKEVPHMARYYHHEDVHVDGMKVDIQSYVRQGLDFKAGVIVGKTSDHAKEPHNAFINRIHRRLILRDVGEPITNVDSPVRLLEALEGCIKGHQALLAAGFLHRDISTNNLMINNQAVPPAPKSFLIDLDLAIGYPIPTDQVHYTRTGTKVFMSVNFLAQVCEHDFADDLGSFFWVLIWICIHYPANERKKPTVTNWSQMNPESLKQSKRDYLRHPDDLTKDFTSLYAKSDLINCVHEFAKIMGDPGVRGDQPATLYSTILKLLEKSRDKLSKRE